MRIPIAIAAAALLILAPVARHELSTTPAVAQDSGLPAAVSARAADRVAGPGGTRVDVEARSTADWGFGSVVQATLGVAVAPRAWLFIAHRAAGQWRVALEGEADFARLGAEAPILGTAERAILGAPARETGGQGGGGTTTQYGDLRTGIGLPYAVGQTWQLGGGPHPMAVEGARSSLDLTGGDGIVRAAADGIAYTMCGGRGWIRVLHARGFATDYYHLEDNIDVSGVALTAGAYLGRIGSSVPCGGYSTGPHVHFSLLRGGEYVPLNGYSLGGWVITEGAAPRSGTLRHGSQVVGIGDYVLNYGPQALDAGVVDTAGVGYLPRRSGPGDGYRQVGQVTDGAVLSVVCSVRGSLHRGRSAYGTSIWNRLSDGSYVSDAFLATGTSGPVRGYCP
jgi:LasA protease